MVDDINELIELCAIDNELFVKTFFPDVSRQASPEFHKELWKLLHSENRFINAQVFRGGAKTSLLRMYTAKKIAYGLSHTILYIGKSESHALNSIKWIKNQIERNDKFSKVFNLKVGKKWQDSEAEIWHGTESYPIWILGLGITGSIRGINLDGYRPDLIVIDDVIDEENSATVEQRQKIEELILGALKGSLAPASEAPEAKMVMLQTPLNKDDASCKATKDGEWTSMTFGCWTEETQDLALEEQVSAWEVRYPTQELREEKLAAIARNKLSLWNREKECKLTSKETSTFKENWLSFYDDETLPKNLQKVVAIDPVPPPSDIQIAKGLKGKDYEAFACVGRSGGNFYLLDYSFKRGHTPEWTVNEFFRFGIKWRPLLIIVETVAYQKTLAWLLKKAMDIKQIYFVIKETKDRRSKYNRIVDALSGIAAQGKLFVKKEHVEFIAQFRDYPDISHDDLIEVVAVACEELSSINYMCDDDLDGSEENLKTLIYYGDAP